MTNFPSGPDDQPALRARIPTHVANGQISTGVIIVTGPMEFLLDFVRSLPRPNAIVSRVVLPHGVMPQFIQALEKNLDLFRQRFGPIPGEETSKSGLISGEMQPPKTEPLPGVAFGSPTAPHGSPSSHEVTAVPPNQIGSDLGKPIDVHLGSPVQATPPQDHREHTESAQHAQSPRDHNNDPRQSRVASPQDIYDELKLRDELLSGTYANAVMIGHGQYEFSFDFITNFYPQSAVSARVFMAAGHVPRLLESLKAAWEQLRPRLQGGF